MPFLRSVLPACALCAALAGASSAAQPAAPATPTAQGAPLFSPEGGISLGASSVPCSNRFLLAEQSDLCLRASALARAAVAIGPVFTVGLRQIGYLDRNTLAWGSSAELRLNLPIGDVQLFLSGGAGPGSARQSDGPLARTTGLGWYAHGGAGLRLLGDGPGKGGAYVEFAIEAQRWQRQGALAIGGLEQHVDLSQPYFSLAVGWSPPLFGARGL